MKKFISVFKTAKDGVWEMFSSKGEVYQMWFFIGKVMRGNEYGYLICFGPFYYIFRLTK